MPPPDPWVVLGLPPGSSVAEARAARRRLAKQFHPDVHSGRPSADQAELAELSARMTAVNQALTDIEGGWVEETAAERAEDGPAGRGAEVPRPAYAGGPDDPDSLSVELLPAEAFEALFLAAYGLGDILVADEPYLLELFLTEPSPCFCRLTLVPEAGGSIVTVEVSPAAESVDTPSPSAVVEVLVTELNALVTS